MERKRLLVLEKLGNNLGSDEKKEFDEYVEREVKFLVDKMDSTSIEKCYEIIKDYQKYHEEDPNFPHEVLHFLDNENKMNEDVDFETKVKLEAIVLAYHSPYPEVRAVVDPVDRIESFSETWRAYLLGLFWVIVGTAINQFFSTRQPSISVSGSLLQLLIFPSGLLFSWIFPNTEGCKNKVIQAINPGQWSQKEQTLATIMFNITSALPYVSSQLFVQKLPMFYNHTWAGPGYQICLVCSTQLLGFGIAGLMRRILVYPSECIWPSNLPILALNKALLRPEPKIAVEGGWTITRYKFFLIGFGCSAAYFWLPNYLFEALSNFNWITWISPKNVILGTMTAMYGMGLNPFPTFDWNIINSNEALVTPFFSYANHYIGVLLSGCVFIPAIYFTNIKWTQYFPINSNAVFTNKGEVFEVSRILSNGKFDEQKYQNYSPPFYSAASLVVYGAFFLYYPASIVYSLLYHRTIIFKGTKHVFDSVGKFICAPVKRWRMYRAGLEPLPESHERKNALDEFTDSHSTMMKRYKEAPDRWYLAILLLAIALGIVSVRVYPTETPIWGVFLALALGTVFLIPNGLMMAMTNMSIGLNVLSELIAGYALPGNGTAMMIIKAFGYNTNIQALRFVSDLKLGHYAKIPPRATFRCQFVATIVSGLVTIGVINWQMNNYEGICSLQQPQRFTCPHERTFFSASIVWGVIGPKRVFSHLYPGLKYCFLAGCFIPLPFYFLDVFYGANKRDNIFKFAHPLVLLAGMLVYAPYSLAFHTVGFYVSIISHKIIRPKYPGWWNRYNYILSCALDSGVAFSAVIIFFAVQYHNIPLDWWGNTVSTNGYDGTHGTSLLQPPKEGFGPPKGKFP